MEEQKKQELELARLEHEGRQKEILIALGQRLLEREYLETEFITKYGNWHRIRIIARQRDEIEKAKSVLYVTQIIDDEKQYEEHLLAQAEHADYANRSKTAVVSQVAHDIRTPMNSIFGFLEIAEANIHCPEKVQYSLEKIRIAGELLKDLANDVLDITRMEDGKVTLQPEVFSLSKMLNEFIISMKNAQFGKQHIFHVDIHDIFQEQIVADSMRLKQILSNVMSNAIRYTPDGGVIEFTAYQEKTDRSDYVRFVAVVADTGIGMSEEFMEKMFGKFERGTDTRINKVRGYGLGLTIVKQLVDLMGGTVQVQSHLGEGTVFTICLEVPYVHVCKEAETLKEVDYEAACAGLHLLVAEDNELNREVITELLRMHQMTCDCIPDGAACLERFAVRQKAHMMLF